MSELIHGEDPPLPTGLRSVISYQVPTEVNQTRVELAFTADATFEERIALIVSQLAQWKQKSQQVIAVTLITTAILDDDERERKKL